MLKIQYEIKLNESERPYIYLPEDYRDNPHDRFFALEMSRYMLQMVYARKSDKFDEESVKAMEISLATLERVSDEVAVLLKQEMEFLGEVDDMFETNFHHMVENIEERDNLPDEGIVSGGKILKRRIGLRIFVKDVTKIFELVGGIANENWTEV